MDITWDLWILYDQRKFRRETPSYGWFFTTKDHSVMCQGGCAFRGGGSLEIPKSCVMCLSRRWKSIEILESCVMCLSGRWTSIEILESCVMCLSWRWKSRVE